MAALALREQIEEDYIVRVYGVKIVVSPDNSVLIENAKSITFKGDDINLEGKRINVHATEEYNLNVDGDIYMGSSTHIIHQAPRIDFNPKVMHSGYNLKVTIKDYIKDEYGYEG